MIKDIKLVSYNRYLHCDSCGARLILVKTNKEEIGACGYNIISKDINYEYQCKNENCDSKNIIITSFIRYPFIITEEENS